MCLDVKKIRIWLQLVLTIQVIPVYYLSRQIRSHDLKKDKRGSIALILLKNKKQTNKQPITYVIQGVNMYNNSKVAKAIRLAMMFGAGAAAATILADTGKKKK